jgi:single-strand DNA-binding protein
MGSLNKVQLIGNLGADPELKYLPSGQPVCELRLATNEQWTKDGQKKEKVEWHRVVIWGKLAENCAQYLKKGRQAYVEGRLQTRSWDDKKSGEKKYATEIVAQSVVFLGGDGGGGGRRAAAPEDDERDPSAPSSSSNNGSGDDDIPF